MSLRDVKVDENLKPVFDVCPGCRKKRRFKHPESFGPTFTTYGFDCESIITHDDGYGWKWNVRTSDCIDDTEKMLWDEIELLSRKKQE